MFLFKRLLLSLSAFALIAGIGATGTASAAAVTIVVNGTTVNFDQPPEERAGRVFVPLRGVFERLGASVVYANGQINATGNGKNVSLHIGSTQATVNGQPVTVDVAPFLVGSRTLVPLRFVAQALGASVDYNNSSRVVTINNGGTSQNVTVTPMPSPGTNFIRVSSPAAGTKVGATFTLSGRTRPNATITVAARGQALIGGVLPVNGGTYHNSTTADNTGYFSLNINIQAVPGGNAQITIRSVAPGGATVQRTFNYPT